MLTRVCQEIRNWFEVSKVFGKFAIENGIVSPSINDLKEGQYYRIVGSVFNDGVHKHGEEQLIDETFQGAIWLMAIPNEIILLSSDIEAYQSKYGDVSPFSSESFGGYTYSRQTTSNGTPVTWKEAFSSKLNRWRKI